jgi:hypothetical protein
MKKSCYNLPTLKELQEENLSPEDGDILKCIYKDPVMGGGVPLFMEEQFDYRYVTENNPYVTVIKVYEPFMHRKKPGLHRSKSFAMKMDVLYNGEILQYLWEPVYEENIKHADRLWVDWKVLS